MKSKRSWRSLLQKQIKRIMITGASGTIGSELTEILQGEPLTLVDIDENGLYELREKHGDVLNKYVMTDIAREGAVSMSDVKTVFHCAAKKHVDICEKNAWQTILTNVYGTRNLIKQAIEDGVETFVLISSDKAVNPIGVMGATKLLAEKLMHWENTKIKLITVRFGNIWASRGSLVTRIKTQVEEGNPITITDPLMQRYYFTIEQAGEFIIKASEKGKNGEIWIPKMELKPLPEIIDEIKTELGVPIDYHIKTIGIRAGEKMVEELYTEQERLRLVEHKDLYLIPPIPFYA